jgi:hypothetical protein
MVRARSQMIRVQANILAVLVSALSVASIFMTHTLFTVVKNVQFESRVMKKEYSQSFCFSTSLFLLTKSPGN